MKGYSETDVFSQRELHALQLCARTLDHGLDLSVPTMEKMRCHEMARIASLLLRHNRIDSAVVDGYYGSVEHSWVVLPWSKAILDPYAVGRLPQVQLVDTRYGLAELYKPYQEGRLRDDVDTDLVDQVWRDVVAASSRTWSPMECGHAGSRS